MGEDDDSISATKDTSNEESDDDKSDENTEDVDSSTIDSEVLDEIQHEEQLAAVRQGGCEDEGEDAELHVYEVRQDVNGERVSLRTGTRSEMSVLHDRSYRACMVLFRYYLQNRDLNFVELRIQSPHIKKALQEVIGAYPGITLHTAGNITIREPPMCLFHYRRELEAYAGESDLPAMKRHLKLLLGYMEKTLEREIRQYEATFDHQTTNASLEHQHLWMGYKPGELLFSMPDDAECVVRMASMSKVMKPMFRSTEIDHWIINVERIEWQGERMVWVPYSVPIPHYDGCQRVGTLPVAPWKFHPNQERAKRELIARGRQYQQLAGVSHQTYHGPARFFDPVDPSFVVTHSNVRYRTS